MEAKLGARQFDPKILSNAKPEALPALTVWQPWATLITEGCKPFEFRGWAAPRRFIGRRIAIHAGARPMRRAEINDLFNRVHGDGWYTTGLVDRAKVLDILDRAWRDFRARGQNDAFPLSSVLCTAVLGQPIRDETLATALGIPWNDSDRDEHSSWGWPLTEIEPVIPMAPARGAQGFWRWTR